MTPERLVTREADDVAVVARPPSDVKVDSDAGAEPDWALKSSQHAEPRKYCAFGHSAS
jgi:hypothetical protein